MSPWTPNDDTERQMRDVQRVYEQPVTSTFAFGGAGWSASGYSDGSRLVILVHGDALLSVDQLVECLDQARQSPGALTAQGVVKGNLAVSVQPNSRVTYGRGTIYSGFEVERLVEGKPLEYDMLQGFYYFWSGLESLNGIAKGVSESVLHKDSPSVGAAGTVHGSGVLKLTVGDTTDTDADSFAAAPVGGLQDGAAVPPVSAAPRPGRGVASSPKRATPRPPT